MRPALLLTAVVFALAAPAVACEGDEAPVPIAELLSEVPLVDGHNDLVIHFIDFETGEFRTAESYDIAAPTTGQSDIPRMRQGMLGGGIFTIWTNDDSAPEAGLEQSIALFRNLATRNPDDLAVVTSPDELLAAHREGKVSILLGLEGGNPVEGDLGRIAWMKERGVVEMGLVWSSNGLGSAGRDSDREDGLTDLGKQVVREINRVGMIVDLSHASLATVRDVVAISSAPVIDSHAYSAAASSGKRAQTDASMRATASTGGLVMLMFMPDATDADYKAWMEQRNAHGVEIASKMFGRPFDPSEIHYLPWPDDLTEKMEAWIASNPPPPLDIKAVADVFDHVREIVGIDHVGIGSDFDGMGFHQSGWHPGLRDVSRLPALFEELRARGWSDADLKKLAGENFLRVWRDILAAAEND